MKILLLLFVFTLKAETQIIEFAGQATSAELNYIEKNEIHIDQQGFAKIIKTNYFDLHGKKIGELVSDFSKNLFFPDSLFQDYYAQRSEQVELDVKEQKIKVVIKDLKRKTTKTSYEDFHSDMVSGQGFHNYIVQAINNKFDYPDKFKLFIPFELDYLTFKMSHRTDGDKATITIGANSFLLGLFLDKIITEYSVSQKRLLKYQGLSFMKDLRGRMQKVTTFFSY